MLLFVVVFILFLRLWCCGFDVHEIPYRDSKVLTVPYLLTFSHFSLPFLNAPSFTLLYLIACLPYSPLPYITLSFHVTIKPRGLQGTLALHENL